MLSQVLLLMSWSPCREAYALLWGWLTWFLEEKLAGLIQAESMHGICGGWAHRDAHHANRLSSSTQSGTFQIRTLTDI